MRERKGKGVGYHKELQLQSYVKHDSVALSQAARLIQPPSNTSLRLDNLADSDLLPLSPGYLPFLRWVSSPWDHLYCSTIFQVCLPLDTGVFLEAMGKAAVGT